MKRNNRLLLYLTQTGNGGGLETSGAEGAVGARQLDEAGQVVEGGRVHAGHTVGAASSQGASGHHQLHLAEHTTGRSQGLAHILENSLASITHQCGGVGRNTIDIGGDLGQSIGTGVHVEPSSDGGNVDIITGIGRDLLGVRSQGRHLLYSCRRK
jgi:hypothetical protein